MTQTLVQPSPAEVAPRRVDGWYVARTANRFTLARQWPPRFDVSAGAAFPPSLDPARLARQIRQDLWRRLQRLRGFSPVLQIDRQESGLFVTAGGRLAGRGAVPSGTRDQIAALIGDPAHRARWIRWARTGGQA